MRTSQPFSIPSLICFQRNVRLLLISIFVVFCTSVLCNKVSTAGSRMKNSSIGIPVSDRAYLKKRKSGDILANSKFTCDFFYIAVFLLLRPALIRMRWCWVRFKYVCVEVLFECGGAGLVQVIATGASRRRNKLSCAVNSHYLLTTEGGGFASRGYFWV